MNPSPNQFPQPSGFDRSQTDEPPIRRPNPPLAATPATVDSDNSTKATTAPSQESLQRQQPIPPPSEPMQYRAIGLVRGKYSPSEEQFTRGCLVATDGQAIDAVLLGRVMSLVKNHLELETEHLWVVYPRTRQEDDRLHLQIVGVWEPEKLDKASAVTDESVTETESAASNPVQPETPPVEDGYFSIRGEVIFQSQDQKQIVVKIRQAPRKDDDKPKFFKLKLNGIVEKKAVGRFWDFQVRRQVETLVIHEAQDIGILRPRKPTKPRQSWRPPAGRGPGLRRQERPIRPGPGIKPIAEKPITEKPTTEKPIKRPVKRQQQSGGEG